MKKILALSITLLLFTACGGAKPKAQTVTPVSAPAVTQQAISPQSSVVTQAAVVPVVTKPAVAVIQPTVNQYGVPDATVIVHQNTLNNFLAAVGKISGKSPFSVLGLNGEYVWTMQNARIDINPGAAKFIADANVSIGNIFSYSSVAEGNVEVKYDNITNRIFIKVQEAKFEVYAKVFGNKIHITDIDAAKFYKPEFQFAGPQPVQTQIDLKLPDGTVKKIAVKMTGQNMRIEKNQIVVTSNLKFDPAN